MKAVLTADIINSREVNVDQWLPALEISLNELGKEYQDWEIYRGDSIQLISSPQKILSIAIRLKAEIKRNAKIDLRQAIGIGEIDVKTNKISTSSGSAFLHSGNCFDQLKKSTLAIETPWPDFNEVINVMIELANLNMDAWKPTTAQIVAMQLRFPETKQDTLSEKLGMHQSSFSKGLKRGGYDEILQMIKYYEKQMNQLC